MVKNYPSPDDSDDEGAAPTDNRAYKDALDTGVNDRDRAEREKRDKKVAGKMEMAMPRCALVSFSVKGWLASGVKVESLKVIGGKGLGEGVKPYKGVKYLTKAGNIEVRC